MGLKSSKIPKNSLETLNTSDTVFYSIFCRIINENIVHETIEFFRSLDPRIKNVNIILHITNGGNVSDCAILTRLFLNCEKVLTFYIPEMAISSGTQLALTGKLVMGKYACLTPIDDQIDPSSDYGSYNVQKFKGENIKSENIILKAKYLRKITKKEFKQIMLHNNYSKDTIKKAGKLFLKHKLYHEYPINIDMIRETGIPVEELTETEIWDVFNELYQDWYNK